jgi:hypothetical protein
VRGLTVTVVAACLLAGCAHWTPQERRRAAIIGGVVVGGLVLAQRGSQGAVRVPTVPPCAADPLVCR